MRRRQQRPQGTRTRDDDLRYQRPRPTGDQAWDAEMRRRQQRAQGAPAREADQRYQGQRPQGQRPQGSRQQRPQDGRYREAAGGVREVRRADARGRSGLDSARPTPVFQNPLAQNIGMRGKPVYASGGHRGSFAFADVFQTGKLVLMGVAALAVLILIISTVYSCSPTTFHVNGQEVSAARNTTYRGLIDQGFLDVQRGNLTAVDGEVLEEGGGQDPTVFLDGNPVDLNARVSEAGDVTAENGEDNIEPYTATQDVTPHSIEVARGSESNPSDSFDFYNGVLHVVTNPGQDGILETRTGETTGKTAKVQVQEMQNRLFENLDPQLSANNKLVAITFDDGPNTGTTGSLEMLEVLAKHNVKATFFVIGSQAEEDPETVKKMADAGHEVASHLYSHDAADYLNAVSPEKAREQVEKARTVIGQITGAEPRYVRPTGGNANEQALVAAGDLADGFIGWDVDTEDWTMPGADAIVQTALDEVHPGSVVLMHDGGGDRSQTVEALDKLIPKLQEEGYQFVTISELVDAILAERGKGEAQQANAASAGAQENAADAQDGDATNGDDADGGEDGGEDEDAEGDSDDSGEDA